MDASSLDLQAERTASAERRGRELRRQRAVRILAGRWDAGVNELEAAIAEKYPTMESRERAELLRVALEVQTSERPTAAVTRTAPPEPMPYFSDTLRDLLGSLPPDLKPAPPAAPPPPPAMPRIADARGLTHPPKVMEPSERIRAVNLLVEYLVAHPEAKRAELHRHLGEVHDIEVADSNIGNLIVSARKQLRDRGEFPGAAARPTPAPSDPAPSDPPPPAPLVDLPPPVPAPAGAEVLVLPAHSRDLVRSAIERELKHAESAISQALFDARREIETSREQPAPPRAAAEAAIERIRAAVTHFDAAAALLAEVSSSP